MWGFFLLGLFEKGTNRYPEEIQEDSADIIHEVNAHNYLAFISTHHACPRSSLQIRTITSSDPNLPQTRPFLCT